ncbi:RWD domain-containing protein 1, partial [Chytriomyces hyalinus]
MSEHHIEEQQNELEALRSIFFDEFSEPDVPTDPPSFRLVVRMDGYYGSGDVPEYSLFVQYTRDYPDTIPIMRIEAAVGLDEDDEVPHLQRLLVESAESQLGMAMVFGVHAAAKEALET